MPTASETLIANRYRIQEQLGKGGMGEVWSAVDLLTRSRVALKRLALAQLSSPHSGTATASSDAIPETMPIVRSSERMESEGAKAAVLHSPATPTPRSGDSNQALRLALAQEFRVLASLRHPCVISVLDYGFDEQKQPFFTMELLENRLNLHAAARDLPAKRQVSLLIRVLQALVYLHRREILHRDLKPQNVLVGQGAVKVLDFGLAVNRHAAAGLSGTISYMAPEILLGHSASVASDLFALGVMAYEMLTGEHPFPHWKNVRERMPEPGPDLSAIRQRHPELPGKDGLGLEAVIGRLLAWNPEDRYPSALNVIEELSAAIGEPTPPETIAIRESFLQAAEFVGREAEVREFRRMLRGLEEGHGATVLIGGESGVGKSRLVEEIRAEALVRGVLVVRGQGVAEAGHAYQEWREPLRRLCLSSKPRDEDLTYLQIFVPDIGDLLDRKVPPLERPDAGTLRRTLLAAASSLFRQQASPVLLILEDLHWTSGDSLALLRELSEVAASHPLLVVGTFRNDEKADLPSLLPGARYLNLPRLPEEAIAKLSRSMLGASGTRPAVTEYLRRQTEGNVFFLVEMVRSLAETAGGLELIASENIPERLTTQGISQIVTRRLQRVPAKWRDAMDVAAVAGRQLDLDMLGSALAETDLAEWLRDAADCAVFDLQEGQWRFAHDKLREAILADLSSERSVQLHERVARAIEDVFAEPVRPAARLAYHWARAVNREREQHYAALTGAEMLRGAAYASAIEYLERAVGLLPFLPREHAQQELPLQLNLGTAYLITKGHASQAMKLAFDRAGELCVALGEPAQLFRVLFGQSTFYLFRGELEACRELAERCLHHAIQSKDPDMLLESHFALGNALYWQGEFAGAVEQMQQVIAQFRPHQHDVHTAHFGHNPRITCLTYGAWATWALGYPDSALRLAKDALALAEERNHGFSRAIAVQAMTFVEHQRRDAAETKRYATMLIEQAGDYPTYLIAGNFMLGWALIREGSVAEGAEAIRGTWKQWTEAGAGLAHSLYTTFLLEAALQSDDLAEGLNLANGALARARELGEHSHESELCRLRGHLVWKISGSADRAEADFREAVSVARCQQARSYELRALNSLCQCRQDAAARAELATAYAGFSEGFETEDLETARQILEVQR
jgi:serine/threonine protein kinase/tetratricopeptide (TPR) repeat protein